MGAGKHGRIFGVATRIALVPLLLTSCRNLGGSDSPSSDPGQTPVTNQAGTAAAVGKQKVWLVLKQQANVASASSIADWRARGQFVHDELKRTADAAQAPLRARLTGRGVRWKPFWIVNAIYVEADQATIDALAKDPAVASVERDRIYELPPMQPGLTEATVQGIEWGLNNIKAPQVWSTLNVRGEGIVIANIDTGVQFDHPALVRQYRGNKGNGVFDHNYNWYDPSNVCPPGVPCDNHNHGTHTMGTMVGDDGDPGVNQIGVAPHATWIAAKGCEGATGCSTEALLSSGQWVLAPTDLAGQMPKPELRPHIVNNSWGSSGNDLFYQSTVQAWVAAGIFPSFSNGNNGAGCNTAGSPGEYPESYGVGAYDSNNAIASFSSRGASFLGPIKPNISAPGVNVRSAIANPAGSYGVFSGTSMAAPHLSGAVALMWSATPSLARDIAATRAILDLTAIDTANLSCGGTAENNNVFGQGRLDTLAAATTSPPCPAGAPSICTVSVSPAKSEGGGAVTGTVKLNVNAPAGGAVVQL